MRIRSLRLRNGYKRFHDLTIDLGTKPARFVALVGPNGCGKSSVFDGLLYLQSAHRMVGNTGEMDRGYHSLYNVTNYDQENVEVSFVSGSYEEVWRDKTAEGTPGTIFAFRSPYRYNSGIKIEETRAMADIALNDYGASTTVALDQKMQMNYRRLLAKFNRYRDEHDVKPSKAREKIIGDLNKAISTCLDLAITDLGDVESGRGTIYFAKSDQSTKFEYDVLSSGEKEVLDILLDIYLRQDDYADSVFLIDEPELHISTGIQRKLLQEIDNLVGADCQIWLQLIALDFCGHYKKTSVTANHILSAGNGLCDVTTGPHA